MDELRKLQEKYRAGKIDKKEYDKQLKELLDDETIGQEDYDEAKDFDPEKEDQGDKPIYTQDDVDRMIVRKARKMLRSELKKAGVEVEASNKELLQKVAELAKQGTEAQEPAADEKEVKKLRKEAEKVPTLESKVKQMSLENAVLKTAGKYNPHNPAQVVRALTTDYMDLIEYDDETGAPVQKSINTAIKRVAQNEPNLFQKEEGDGGDEDGEGDEDEKNNPDKDKFGGKPPGGGNKGNTKKTEQRKAEALEMMGVKQDKK